ncbi:MAG: hypothetical protein PW789_07360 [Edaphobacter sp.]|uniref:hypothetical protein n=1 Tax=Edaphobacter sp. TaxID=1934404 RepID=UPI0023A6FA19|nr:hypothetical protein [Edaphobacter sp.]MDE1176412.1 hypothetical protein [Edaphobacter sp.]
METSRIAAAGLIVGMLVFSGCRIEQKKNGDNENVSVATPFGGVKVKTNDATGIEGIGLPIYPGAELVKKKDKDSGSADVNLSFGKFQLRVKAASYRTPDGTEKIQAYYRDALRKYGTVIACNHDQPVGSPVRTDDGLTCSENDKHSQVVTSAGTKIELKAGSKQHQHIVAIEPEGDGTKFGLVALDLPIGFSGNSDSDARQ